VAEGWRAVILVDTHVFLWALRGDRDLGPGQRVVLDRHVGRTFLSIATLWEIEIKRRLGKLTAPGDLEEGAALFGWAILPIRTAHTTLIGTLPLLHGDPFDRMLVAQAKVEGMSLMTADRQLAAYDVPVLW